MDAVSQRNCHKAQGDLALSFSLQLQQQAASSEIRQCGV
jgi:hypothetical protein